MFQFLNQSGITGARAVVSNESRSRVVRVSYNIGLPGIAPQCYTFTYVRVTVTVCSSAKAETNRHKVSDKCIVAAVPKTFALTRKVTHSASVQRASEIIWRGASINRNVRIAAKDL